jgi:hypothetical protein
MIVDKVSRALQNLWTRMNTEITELFAGIEISDLNGKRWNDKTI